MQTRNFMWYQTQTACATFLRYILKFKMVSAQTHIHTLTHIYTYT